MTQENFLYWLKGYLEMARTPIDEYQIELIQERLESILKDNNKGEKYSADIFSTKKDADGYSIVQLKEPVKSGQCIMTTPLVERKLC